MALPGPLTAPFGLVNLSFLQHTNALNYPEIGLSHTLRRSELKRPRDTEGRLFFDATNFVSIGLSQATCVFNDAMTRNHLLLRAIARK